METMSSSSSPSGSHKTSHYDELSMQQSLLFSDSLKDLKSLRTQLYSAAEYFELSYATDDQKNMVVETLKDYINKAIINTVDHLGSVTYKVNALLDEKIDQVSQTEHQISSIEQKLRTYQKFIDHEGLCQQSLDIMIPKYHKRYLLPVGETLHGSGRHVSKQQWCSLDDEDDWHQFRHAVRSSIRDTPSSVRKGYSASPSLRPALRLGTFSFTEKQSILDKKSSSPHRAKFPLLRSGSLSSRPTTTLSSRSTTPLSSRSTTPNYSKEPKEQNSPNTRKRYPSEPRKSVSMRLHAEKDNARETKEHPSKSKRLLKALLSRRKSKKDESLYTFLDEY